MNKLNLVQGSDEWLEYRKQGIGGSDIGAIAGFNEYKSRQDVFEEKLGREVVHSDYTKQLMSTGHSIEEQVRQDLLRQGYIYTPVVVQDPENPRFFSSMDGWDELNRVVLEVKWTSKREVFDAFKAGTMPPHWDCQLQWAFSISGAIQGLIVASHNGETHAISVTRNETVIEHLREAGAKFLSDFDEAKSKGISYATMVIPHDDRLERLVFLKNEQKRLQQVIDRLKDECDSIAKKFLDEFKSTRLESDTVIIQSLDRLGSVDYSKIPGLENVNLDKYRKKSSTFVRVDIK